MTRSGNVRKGNVYQQEVKASLEADGWLVEVARRGVRWIWEKKKGQMFAMSFDVDFFKRWLDHLASFKMNTLLLELGGGMEFKRHPKVNRAWKKFCRDAAKYDLNKDPDRKNKRHPAHRVTTGPLALQASRYFPKDSTHTELAGGDWLTRKEVRWIMAECRKHLDR